jgi:hypothetical protein
MKMFRSYAIGLPLSAGALLVTSASEAKVPVAPLKSETTITKAAEGCGPGGWRGPGEPAVTAGEEAGAAHTGDSTALNTRNNPLQFIKTMGHPFWVAHFIFRVGRTAKPLTVREE